MGIKKTITGTVLTITTDGQPDIRIDLKDLAPAIADRAALHGLSQKIGDAASSKTNDAERYEAMAAVAAHIADANDGDDWNRKPAGDGSGGDGLLVRALVELTGAPRDAIRAKVGAMSKKDQAALRASEPVAGVIARLRAPAPEAAARAQGLLAALMGTPGTETPDALM